jgi:hypothetical protein
MSICSESTYGPTCNHLPPPSPSAPLPPHPCLRIPAPFPCIPVSSTGPPPPKADAGPSSCARLSLPQALPCLGPNSNSIEAAPLSLPSPSMSKALASRSSKTASSPGESALSHGATLEKSGLGVVSAHIPTRAQDSAPPAVWPAPPLPLLVHQPATYAAVQTPSAPAATSAASISIPGNTACSPWEPIPSTTRTSSPVVQSVQNVSGPSLSPPLLTSPASLTMSETPFWPAKEISPYIPAQPPAATSLPHPTTLHGPSIG